jgi:hypothetical protein
VPGAFAMCPDASPGRSLHIVLLRDPDRAERRAQVQVELPAARVAVPRTEHGNYRLIVSGIRWSVWYKLSTHKRNVTKSQFAF